LLPELEPLLELEPLELPDPLLLELLAPLLLEELELPEPELLLEPELLELELLELELLELPPPPAGRKATSCMTHQLAELWVAEAL
jgi:hypothetical protein